MSAIIARAFCSTRPSLRRAGSRVSVSSTSSLARPAFLGSPSSLHLSRKPISLGHASQPRSFSTTASMEEVGSNKVFGGFNKRYKHASSSCGCDMIFQVYMPPQAMAGAKVPVVYYLSGLTCTDENVIQKSGLQRRAAELGIAVVCPDTSPRGIGVEGEADSWDFGVGAGFYVNATEPKWKNWRMYEYVTEELPTLLAKNMPILDTTNAGIMGHSMGGHGALTVALKNPGKYKSISAFAPICHPTAVPWGEKAFTGYLGGDREAWKAYDATELAKSYNGPVPHILIDQGSADNFLAVQLKPQDFASVGFEKGFDLSVRMQEGYDHSYFFIATFMGDHLDHHARFLLPK